MKRSFVVVAAGLALGLSACGTTVPLTSQAVVGSNGLQSTTGGGSAAGASSGTPGINGSQSGALQGGTTGTGGAYGSSGTAGSFGTGGSASGPALSSGRGITKTTITIGVPVDSGTAALASAMGISGAGSVGEQQAVDAVLADINASGGILGRKVVASYYSFNTAEFVANPSQVVNEICTNFRDDHPVFAVFASLTTQELRDCMANMGTLLIGGDEVSVNPASAFTAHGGNYFYAPNAMTVERLAKLFVGSLMARNFHEKWDTTAGAPGGLQPVRLGVIHADAPDLNALYAAYAKELAKYGLKFTDTVTYSQNVQAGLAATQNAVLKFRADGITHVYGASAFFLQDAENQKYRPRYAYIPGLGALGAQNVPAAQMNGAMTVGWEPTDDVNQAQDPGDTRGAARCRAVMRKAGISASARADQLTIYAVCDLLYVFKAALNAAGAPNVAAFRHGYESLGSTFPTALTFDAKLGPDHHYGSDSVRDIAWNTPCACLEYTSKTNRS